MAGPDAKCGFGKFNPVKVEQGEDNGLLVNKAIYKCYFVDQLYPEWLTTTGNFGINYISSDYGTGMPSEYYWYDDKWMNLDVPLI